MEIYLPIAEMSVHWLIVLGMGGAVGFLSGMFGIGGGFLLTPLLIFYGIPPGVAVATTASQVTASTFSGVLSHWRRRSVDLKMGMVMLAGGLAGTALGVYMFGVLRRLGQSELSRFGELCDPAGIGRQHHADRIRCARFGPRAPANPPAAASPASTIGCTACPSRCASANRGSTSARSRWWGSDFVVGVLSAIMGVGGGFLMVPVMIYILRMPTNVVVGTSLFQVLFVTAAATVLHAVDNYTVDIVLGGLLILGGVVGAQFGARVGARLRGEELRLLLALLVLAVAVTAALQPGGDAGRSLQRGGERAMRRAALLALLLFALPIAADAEDLVSGLSQDLIEITSNYTGTDIVVFGAIESHRAIGRRRA